MNEKFDIIILAGQSNAEGNGLHKDAERNIISDKVYQLIDKNPAYISEDSEKRAILNITMPVEMKITLAEERAAAGGFAADISETFASDYIAGGYLEDGRKILIVKTAVGGSGFAKNQWGVGKPLLDRLFQMVDYALSLNSENRIVALLWHQGEHDAFENADFTPEERCNFYKTVFMAQTNEIRKRYSAHQFPVITGEFVNDWASKWKVQCDAVEKALKDACEELGNAGICTSEGLLSNDQSIKNGDDIHFCADSVYELAHRYYEKFKTIKG